MNNKDKTKQKTRNSLKEIWTKMKGADKEEIDQVIQEAISSIRNSNSNADQAKSRKKFFKQITQMRKSAEKFDPKEIDEILVEAVQTAKKTTALKRTK